MTNPKFYSFFSLLSCVVLSCTHLENSPSRLEKVAYHSEATGLERDYFVYLPLGFEEKDHWPVILFLHGNGERGDGKADLDYLLVHGPLFEAWSQKKESSIYNYCPAIARI